MLCSLWFLSACFNESYDFRGKEFEEPVQAILVESDKIYFIGSTIDAIFDKTLIDNTKASDVIYFLNKLLQSPYGRKISNHRITLAIYDENIQIQYSPQFIAENLTMSDIQALQKLGFQFSHSKEYLWKSYAGLGGKITQFKNRKEILEKYKFKQPIITKAKSYQKSIEFSFDDTISVIAAPITIPASIILLPFFNDAPQ